MAAREDTPTGMQPAHDSTYLVFHRAHPHLDEYNNPIAYGGGFPGGPSENVYAFTGWQDDRATNNVETGSPLVTPPQNGAGRR